MRSFSVLSKRSVRGGARETVKVVRSSSNPCVLHPIRLRVAQFLIEEARKERLERDDVRLVAE